MRHTFLSRVIATLVVPLAALSLWPTAAAADEGDAPPAADEWFGGAQPIWEWSRMTGDWDGYRTAMEDAGVTVEGSFVWDASYNLDGGVKEHGIERWLMDLNVTFDMETIFGWSGNTIFIDGQFQSGQVGPDDTGDIQGYSNIDADDFQELYEFWIEQQLFEDRVRIKVGKVDANSEFAYVENGGEFINSSMGFTPTILAFPTYPDPAFSVNVFVYPTEYLYAGFGLYDGATQAGTTTGPHGTNTVFGNPSDLFYIGEVGGTWNLGSDGQLPGRLGVGGWHHNGTFDRFDGGTDGGAEGFYLVLDQALWREGDGAGPTGRSARARRRGAGERVVHGIRQVVELPVWLLGSVVGAGGEDLQGIDAFFQFGVADEDVAEIDLHVGGGVTWTGPIPGRNEDVAGIGVTWVHLSDEAGAGFTEDDELATELFYKAQITPWFSLKPDLQIIRHPGGMRALDTVVVATVRAELSF